ncbi:MAG: flippase-like domain-containing protein [Anaerolineales bacterium]|nr:flippase-like domain-containing protein [Anaerolineales bacterium]
MQKPANNHRGDWRKILPGLFISALALAVVLYLVDLRQMLAALRLADYRLVALVYLLTVLWVMVRTVAWRTLLQEKATLGQVFLTVNEGYLLNNILPFRLGEVGRSFLLGRKAGLGFMHVFSTVLIERALDMGFSAAVLLISLPFVVGAEWASQAAILAGGLVLLGLGMLYLLARYRDWALAQFERLAARWPLLGRLGKNQVLAFFAGLAVLTDGWRFLRAVFWIALNWLIAVFQFYGMILAFFPGARLLWAVFCLGVVTLGVAAPSSPGAVGVLELAMVGALYMFGLDQSVALAAALTTHLTNYLVTGLVGAYALARDGLSLSGLYRDVRHISTDQP